MVQSICEVVTAPPDWTYRLTTAAMSGCPYRLRRTERAVNLPINALKACLTRLSPGRIVIQY